MGADVDFDASGTADTESPTYRCSAQGTRAVTVLYSILARNLDRQNSDRTFSASFDEGEEAARVLVSLSLVRR